MLVESPPPPLPSPISLKRGAEFSSELTRSKSQRNHVNDTFAGRTCREEAHYEAGFQMRTPIARSASSSTLKSARSTLSLMSLASDKSDISMQEAVDKRGGIVATVEELPPPYDGKDLPGSVSHLRPYVYAVQMQLNHRVRGPVRQQAAEIVSFTNQAYADRFPIPENKAQGLRPMLGYENGAPTLALSNVKPSQLMLVKLADLRSLVARLNTQQVRVRYWNENGDCATKRMWANKQNTRSVSGTTAFALMMHMRGSGRAATRIMYFAPSTVRKELTRLGVPDYIDDKNIHELLNDAVMHIADPGTLGTERAVAAAASTAVFKYLTRTGRDAETLAAALVKLLEGTTEVQSADAAGALVGVLLSGFFKYIERVESQRRALIVGAKAAASVGIGFLEEVPGGKVAARILDLLVDAAADAAQERGSKSLREALRTFVVEQVKFKVEKSGYLPGMEEAGMEKFSEAGIARFSRWLDLTLETNGYGPITGR